MCLSIIMSILVSTLLAVDGVMLMYRGCTILGLPYTRMIHDYLTRFDITPFRCFYAETTLRPTEELGLDQSYRFLAYIALLLGISRFYLAFFWQCGFLYLALIMYIWDIFVLCHELMHHDSMVLNRALYGMLESFLLIIVIMWSGVAACHS